MLTLLGKCYRQIVKLFKKMAYTGYKIITYIDVNPQSPTFNTTRTERVSDTGCSQASSDWQTIGSYCEINASGANTGYYVVTEMDTNVDSATYGQTRENRTMNLLLCPPPSTNPQWAVNVENSYCETKVYEPAMVEGNTGRFIASLTDNNRYSPSFGTTITSALTESDWTQGYQEEIGPFPCQAPSTSATVEEISYACVLEEAPNGELWQTGEIKITGIDKNPYSSTYLQTTTVTQTDYTRCPPNNPNKCDCSALTLSSYSTSFAPAGGTNTVNYSLPSGCEITWTKPSWITVTKNTGSFSITASQNSGQSSRSGNVVFNVERNEGCATLAVSQSYTDPCICNALSMSTTSLSYAYAGGSNTVNFSLTSGCELSWSKPSWITITNNGNSLTITASQNSSETIRTGNIVFSVGSHSNCHTISVSQEYPHPSCTCQSLSIATSSLSYGYAASTQTIVYSLVGGCSMSWTKPSWITITDNGGSLSIAASQNSSTASRSGSIVFSVGDYSSCHSISISQEGYTPPTPTCNCNSLTVYDLTSISENGGVYTAATTTQGCTVNMNNIVPNAGALQILSDWSFTNGVLKVTAYTNSSTSIKTGTITVNYYVDGNNCTKYISLMQGGQPIVCSCDDMVFTGTLSPSESPATYVSNIKSGSTTITAATYGGDSSCPVSNFTTSGDSTFNEMTNSITYTNNQIVISVKANSSLDVRTGNVLVTYNVDGTTCRRIVRIIQDAVPHPSCTCQSLSIATSSLSYGYAASTQTLAYSLLEGCSMSWTKPSWITITDNGGSLSIAASQNSSTASRNGSIVFGVGVYSNCHTITVTQEGYTPPTPTCDCDSLTVYDLTSISKDGGVYTAATTTQGCTVNMDNILPDVRALRILSDWSFTNGVLKVTANTNSTSSIRTGTITLSYNVNGNTCTKFVSLIQGA